MKTRILAVLLALAVVLALALPALAAVSADTVPYNTGTRHELCTALSAQAEQYYTDGAETLLKLSGSTSDSSLESMGQRPLPRAAVPDDGHHDRFRHL